MATDNNKNRKFASRDSVKAKRKKLKDISQINVIKSVFSTFINAVKEKHLQ